MGNEDQKTVFSNGDEKLDRIIEMLRSLTLKSESTENRLSALETKFSALETKVEERIKDTRPLWESVQIRLVELRDGQERIEQKIVLLDRKVDLLNKELFEMRAEHSLLHDRVERLERKPS